MRAEWTDELTSGFEKIDTQHKELFVHINAYFNSLEKVYGNEVTIKTLNYLIKYVRYHFSTEEELMKDSQYPDFADHLEDHRKLVDELMGCYKSLLDTGHSEEVVERLRILLKHWLIDHILGFDKKLAHYLKSRNM